MRARSVARATHDDWRIDQVYYGRVEGRSSRLQANYTGIPHAFGNAGKTIVNVVGPNEWRMSDTCSSTTRTRWRRGPHFSPSTR